VANKRNFNMVGILISSVVFVAVGCSQPRTQSGAVLPKSDQVWRIGQLAEGVTDNVVVESFFFSEPDFPLLSVGVAKSLAKAPGKLILLLRGNGTSGLIDSMENEYTVGKWARLTGDRSGYDIELFGVIKNSYMRKGDRSYMAIGKHGFVRFEIALDGAVIAIKGIRYRLGDNELAAIVVREQYSATVN